MKLIGLIGGMSWESTVTYYQILNREALRRLGGVHSAKILLHSVDFADYDAWLKAEAWDEIGTHLAAAGRDLVAGGAEILLICTNTMHKVADTVAGAAGVPLLHICDCTAARIVADGRHKVALLGTAYTMEQAFYRDRLVRAGLDVMLPAPAERAGLQRIIFEELVCGKILPESRQFCRRIIARLADEGAQGIILGCTELPLLIQPEDSPIPLFDTTAIHALAAADLAFS